MVWCHPTRGVAGLVLGVAVAWWTLAATPARGEDGRETEDSESGDRPAGDASSEPPPSEPSAVAPDLDPRLLLRRIEELERRLAELERPRPEVPVAPPAGEGAGDAPTGVAGSGELEEIAAAIAADAGRDGPTEGPADEASRAPRFLQSMNPDLALIADVAFAQFSVDEPLMVGGHDPRASGFTLQQLELSVGAAVDPYVRLDANIVFAQFGVEVEEVYATSLGIPGGFQVRAGQFLTRFGRINATHPHTWDFVDQPLVIGKFFGGEGNRGLGVELSWLTPLPWVVELSGCAIDGRGEATARSFWGADDLGFRDPRDLEAVLALKQFWPLGTDVSLGWGLSWALGPNGTGLGNRTDVFGTDLYIKVRPIRRGRYAELRWQTEALLRQRQVPDALNRDWGGYTSVVVRLAKRWEAGARYELVSGLAADDLDPEWTSLRQRIAPQLTFYPSHFSRLRLQLDLDNPTYAEEPWQVGAMLAFEFGVGAHGAHRF